MNVLQVMVRRVAGRRLISVVDMGTNDALFTNSGRRSERWGIMAGWVSRYQGGSGPFEDRHDRRCHDREEYLGGGERL